MTFVLETRTQRFTFGPSWSNVVSFDEQEDLHPIKECLDPIGTKDVDFIGVRNDKSLCLIEVTDYRENPPTLRKKANDSSLEVEVAQKVRDTIPALVGACRSARKPEKWDPYTRALTDRSYSLSVILWLEDDPDPRRQSANRAKHRSWARLESLKSRLAWLTEHVMVEGRHANTGATLDIKVEDIASH